MAESAIGTAVLVASILGAAATTATTVKTLTSGGGSPIQIPPQQAPPQAPLPTTPPPPAPNTDLEKSEQEARANAARRIRDLQQRRSGSSTILSSPLGVSQQSPVQPTSVLGR